MSRRDNQQDEGHSAFPATVVFFAIVLVGGVLLFRGHLFETKISAHVYVPMPSVEKVALAKVGLEAPR